MIEEIVYVNHLGESVRMDGSDGIYCNRNDLRDFSYSVTARNGRIASFGKGIVKKSLPVVVACADGDAGAAARNRMFEVMEKDVLASVHGRLMVNGYYLRCFVTGSSKAEYYIDRRYAKMTLSVQTDLPDWIRETVRQFGYMSAGPQGRNMDYGRDFPTDYTSNLIGRAVVNTGFVPSNFRIVFYGAAESPAVKVGGHLYQVDGGMDRNEYMTIDSVNKTIILTHEDGSAENMFCRRNRESYIFEKIPPGVSQVELEGCMKADITILEERSEPRWI